MKTLNILKKALPQASEKDIEKYFEPLIETFISCKINTPLRQANFLAQCAHESGNFKFVEENLNYSKEALVRVWPKHFSNITFATPYHRNPEKIANRAYRERMGNGTEISGDGWKYRGRGIIQLTGKNNYRKFGEYCGLDLLEQPDLVLEPKIAVLSAGWFWDVNKLNKIADSDDILGTTRIINGGTHGLEDRTKKYEHIKKILLSSL